MADSEEKDKTQAGTENPSGVTTLVVRNPDGITSREVQKDSKGRFLKKVKPLIPTIEYVRARRKRLASIRKDTGRFDGMSEDASLIEELLEIIHMPIEFDKKTGLPDAKHMSAKIQAAELINLITWGKPAPSDQEMDKLTTQPVRVVIVTSPQLMHPEVREPQKLTDKTKPSFIDAEIVK